MRKRYQVFISSTYRDLIPERQAVLHTLLRLQHIPAGMELFPAANDDAWSHICSVIDECDYYVVLVGGRYGSCAADGVSWTEREYRYAMKRGIPILGFLHENPEGLPADRQEPSDNGKQKLSRFRELVQHRLVQSWSSPDNLATGLATSLTRQVERTPGVGWLRAGALTASVTSQLRGYESIYTAGAELCRRAERSVTTLTLAQSMKAPDLFFDVLLQRLVEAKQKRNPIAYDGILAIDRSQPHEVLIERGLSWQRRLDDAGVADCAGLYIFDMRPPVGFELLIVDKLYSIVGFTTLHRDADVQTALLFEDNVEVARDFDEWLRRLSFQSPWGFERPLGSRDLATVDG